MKQTKHILLMAVLLLCSLAASAHDFVAGDIYYNITSSTDLTVAVTYRGSSSYDYSNEYSGAVTIPSTVSYNGNTYSVTSIGKSAFYGCSSLTSITIPEGVTSIGGYAFYGCSSLTSITIPEGVTSIGSSAFAGCSSLTAINIPEGVTSIGSYAFRGCNSLTSINIPESSKLTSIEYEAFAGCSSLTAITLPEGVTSIGNYAFNGCSSLTSITIPEGVTSIGSGVFYGCRSLTSITIPEGVTSIVSDAFYYCSSLTAVHISSIEAWCKISFGNYDSNPLFYAHNLYLNGELVTELIIPEGVTSIGDYAFYYCSSLTTITIPEGVTSIGNYAFYYCSSLTTITIPESVTSIGKYAFDDCSSLTSITIPEGSKLTSIGSYAFSGCTGELVVNCNIPSASSYSYGAFYGSKFKKVTIGEGVTSIGSYAFYKCTSLTSITIPESVTSIGKYAFYNCTGELVVNCNISSASSYDNGAFYGSKFTKVTIGEGVTSIGNYAFYECSNLTAITLPESVTSIGYGAFQDCSSLTSIVVAEGNTVYDSRDNCNAIIKTRINQLVAGCSATIIPASVTSIGYGAFQDCSSLTAITIPESVTSIESYAFYGCKFTSITIPEGSKLTSIGNYAFYNCTGELVVNCNIPSASSSSYGAFYDSDFTKVTIGEGVTSIGEDAFLGCSSLTAVHISSIEAWCKISFGNYDSNPLYYACNLYLNGELVTELIIPEGVTSIGDGAFRGCRSLTSITIPEGVTSIGKYAFYDCSSLTAIVLPKSVRSIGSKAFANCGEVLDVYCNAEKVPSTYADAFNGSYPDYATLHVPASALETYKTTAPWSSFGNIVPLTEEKVTSITLNQSIATLTEGQTLTLIATVEPGYATDKTITWSSSDSNVATVDDKGKVTAIAPGTATITAKANDGSGVSASCEVTVEAATYVSITINQYGSGTYCSKYALDFSNVEGLKAYAATGYNSGTGVVTLVRVMTAKAGEGIFIKGDPGKYMVPILESTLDNTLNMLVGTLAKTSVNATSDDGLYANYKYTIKEGESQPLFYQFTDGSTLGAGKAYLQIPTAWLPQTNEAKSISLRFEEGEGTTDMENSQFTIDNSQLTYDLYGRRVDNPVKGGIYIVGGRKVVY